MAMKSPSSRRLPVAETGAAAVLAVSVQAEDFDVAALQRELLAGAHAEGAVACFTGYVRAANVGQPVNVMELEHYPGMTERAIQDMIVEAHQRFDFMDALVIHRIGELATCDQIVLVAVTSAHRGESFKACEFLMDYLKTQAPFWKKEATAQGATWVDARESDDLALRKWGIASQNR